MRFQTVGSALALLLMLASCGSSNDDPSTSGEDMAELAGTSWTATKLAGEDLDNERITAAFSAKSIAGGSGCNRYWRDYETDGTSISFPGSHALTKMMCDAKSMRQETEYHEALSNAETFDLSEDSLTFYNGSGDTLVAYVRASQELVGTTWNVTSYATDSGTVSPIVDTEMWVAFETETGLAATAGCNHFSGTYMANDGGLIVSELAQTDMACVEPEGIMDQESAMGDVIDAFASYTIEGNQITILDQSGQTLLTAERQE